MRPPEGGTRRRVTFVALFAGPAARLLAGGRGDLHLEGLLEDAVPISNTDEVRLAHPIGLGYSPGEYPTKGVSWIDTPGGRQEVTACHSLEQASIRRTPGSGARAISVIRTDIAASRRWRYELNMAGLARRYRFDVAVQLVHTAADAETAGARILEAIAATGAGAVIAPSVQHVSGAERAITERVDLFVVGRSRIYRRGHRWHG